MANERTDKQFEMHLFAAVLDLTVAVSALLHAEGPESKLAAEQQARETLRRWGGEGADRIISGEAR